MTPAALYLRVSTDEQTEENQAPDLRRLAAARGWSPVEYRETAGAAKRRPVLERLMDDARRGAVRAVLVWALDLAIAALRDAPAGKFTSVFPPEAVGGKPLDAVLKLMQRLWTSHFDRHGTADDSVPLSVSQEQAEAAVHAAVTLVQWFDRGFVGMSARR